ncbi:MAG: GNAT family N-acetyltransferase [Chloroherpetonaceae bacterium]|nr:GNAT family N-acetyltransferase [Chloroherpetonaceae bacterium]MDW8438009.1 GNAT family N-acetyltransferase [Chloroherpetonaceae bacterium]
MSEIRLRPKTSADQEWTVEFLKRHWNDSRIPLHGDLIDASLLPAFIAEYEDEPVGLLVYHFLPDACEIVSLHSLRKRIGIGEALLNRLEEVAKAKGCKKIKCAVGNDNLNALRFLQKRGFRLSALNVNAMEAARKQNPALSLAGEYGIPLRDELVLEKTI